MRDLDRRTARRRSDYLYLSAFRLPSPLRRPDKLPIVTRRERAAKPTGGFSRKLLSVFPGVPTHFIKQGVRFHRQSLDKFSALFALAAFSEFL